MRIIFFGTPDYVLPVLKKLHKYHEIVAVVTQPPRPVGREKQLTYSAVDNWAHKRKIPVIYDLGKVPPTDLGVCAAYGKKVPEKVIDSFPHGILVIHPSLLPKYRGVSPVQATIAAGEEKTGATVIKMDEKFDHGPIVSRFKKEILPDDTTESLRKRLFERSAQVLIDLIPNYLKGKIKQEEQDHDQATYTKILKKEDGYVDLEKDDPLKIERMLKAYTPWPGIWTTINLRIDKSTNDKWDKKRLKILKTHIEEGKLILDEVQLQGKNPVSWKQFKEAYPSLNF